MEHRSEEEFLNSNWDRQALLLSTVFETKLLMQSKREILFVQFSF